MVTLKEYEAYLRVKEIIDSCDEAEIISKLRNERNYTPMVIQHQQLLGIVGQLNKHWITPIGIGVQE